MQMDSRSDADVLEEAKGCPIDQLNPMHPALLKQPWGMNSRLRQEAPIFQDPGSGIFFVSRYEDVVKMAMDHIICILNLNLVVSLLNYFHVLIKINNFMVTIKSTGRFYMVHLI